MVTFAELLALCEGKHWLPVDFPHKKPVLGSELYYFLCYKLEETVEQ